VVHPFAGPGDPVRSAARRLYVRSPLAVKTVWRKARLGRYGGAGGRVHLLPDFLIIGATRAGTSSLYTYLHRNPLVGKARRKEIHYFDFNYHRGIDWYRSYFPTVFDKVAAERDRGGRFVTGESSPYYIFHPLVPARVRETLPEAKLIALLRNPVDRAYSHYQLQRRNGLEQLSFPKALEQESDRISGAEDENLMHRDFSYLARGIYAEQLERWFELFPREQILVLKSEELFEDPHAIVDAASEFLGVPPRRNPRPRPYNAARYPNLDAETRAFLSEYYREHNRRLYELLGRDFGWN